MRTDFLRRPLLAGLLALSASGATAAMTLSEALQQALDQDPRVAQLDSNYRGDVEAAQQVLAGRRYRVDAFAETSYRRDRTRGEFFGDLNEGYGAFSFGIEARQPVYRRDWTARERQADAIVDRAAATRDGQRQQYLLDLAERYFSVLAERENLALAHSEVRTVARSLEDTRQRYQAQVIAATDLREAEARDDLARARLLAAEQQYDDARQALRERVGAYDELPGLSEQVNALSQADRDLAEWQKLAADASPALEAARAAVSVNRGALASSRAERSARVDLFARLAHQDSSGSQVGQRSSEGVIGLELNVPIYSGGAARSAERQASAELSAAELELASLQRELDRRVAAAWRARQVASRQVSAFEAVVRSAEAAEQAVRNGFDAGTRTMLEVLDANRATVEAERDLLAARYQLILGQLALEQLAGALSQARFAEVDQWLEYRQ